MLSNGRRLGAHLPLGTGMVRAADRAAAIGASSLQVFSDNPTAWSRRERLPDELPAFRARLVDHGIAPLAIHAPYLVNLATPDPVTRERSVTVLANELRVAVAYGARLVNVHIGSHRGDGAEAGTGRVAAALRRAIDGAGPDAGEVTLVLENGSGGGYGLGSTMDELAAIDRAIEAAGIPRASTGFCLDTAHLWGAGYRIDTPAGVDDVVAAFDALIGIDRLRLVHLNDSRSEPGSRADRHEHIGAGRIGAAGLGRFLTHPRLGAVAYILETPGMEDGWDEVNLRRARDAAEGRPLDDLPAHAFETRSARGRSAPPDPEADGHTGAPAHARAAADAPEDAEAAAAIVTTAVR
jgi:deoxyribonuclease-4